jgi:hypothetical protein
MPIRTFRVRVVEGMAQARGNGARPGDTMAMILQFRARRADDGAEDLVQRPGAQIIIFPGVRRERHGEGLKPARRRSKPKRDRLELPD